MKYQVPLLTYLLFTLPNLAQESLFFSITNECNELKIYPFSTSNQSFDTTYLTVDIGPSTIFNQLELSKYDIDNQRDTFYFNDTISENKKFIDQKWDHLNNKYTLTCQTKNDKMILVLEKFSSTDVLLWDYSIEDFGKFSIVPNGITLYNDKQLFISCFKQIKDEKINQSTLFHLSSDGDFLSEITFK